MAVDKAVARLTTAHALAQLRKQDQPFIEMFQHGSLVVEMYQPDEVDMQTPHSRDEICGCFWNGLVC